MQEIYKTKSHLFAASVTALAFSKYAHDYNSCNEFAITYSNKEFTFYLDEASANRRVEFATAFFEVESNFKLYFQQCKNLEIEYDLFYGSLEKDYSSYSNLELASVFNSLLQLQAKCAALYQGTHESATQYFSDKLQEELERSGFNKNDSISLLASVNSDILRSEEDDFVNLQRASSPNFEEFIRKHPWVCAKSFYLDDAVLELKTLLETRKPRQVQSQSNDVSKLQVNNRVVMLVSKLQRLGELRFELKRLLGYKILGHSIYAEIAKRMEIDKKQLFYTYDAFDIINFLREGQTPIKCTNERYYAGASFKIQVLNGNAARDKSTALSVNMNVQSFTGAVTFLGKATGRVRVILSTTLTELTATTFNQGDVLVTSMTNPNMVFLASKASAIVTDEGGVTCHAAIISRELQVPCIVGTKIATKVLKDGDLVEVDATTGTVTKLV